MDEGKTHCRMSPDEEDLILRLHRLLGDRWSLIAGRIPGRSAEEVERYWKQRMSNSRSTTDDGTVSQLGSEETVILKPLF